MQARRGGVYRSKHAQQRLRSLPDAGRSRRNWAGLSGAGSNGAFETLEARAMLAADFVISEFLASNNVGLKDQDNAYSDWIEIHNRGPAADSLNGWYLTDTNNDLSKWRFPDVSIPADGYLVVFASNKNRAVAGSELHTNFKLGAEGEYLALVKPDALTVVSKYSPQYPAQLDDISYGVSESYSIAKPVQLGSAGKLLVPAGDIGTGWTAANYNDSAWTSVSTGIGFDSAAATGVVQAYSDPAGLNGNLSSTLAFGQDFTVNQPIVINQLGVFDSGSDGLNRPLTSQLWRRDTASTGTKLAELQFTSADPGTLVNGDRYKSLSTPLILPPGNYSIVAYGYGGAAATPGTYEPVFNSLTPNGRTTNSGGALSFTGTRFTSAAGSFPVSANANIFSVSAGTFAYTPSLYNDQISSNVQTAMAGINASAYLRIPFNLTEVQTGVSMNLNVKYDDGFVAYLNGQEIARRNAPQTLTWDSAATSEHPNLQAVTLESIDVSAFRNLLVVGSNVLAVQTLNASAANTDFLFNAELVQQLSLVLNEHYYSVPTPGAANSTQFYNQVEELKFSKDHGFYDTSFDVTITSATPGVTIRYTTDGSTPSANSGLVYSGPVHIGTTTTLRAAAFKTSFTPAKVDTKTYLFLDDVLHQPANPAGFPSSWNGITADYEVDPDVVNNPLYASTIKNDLKTVPTLSIVTDIGNFFDPATGIYTNPVPQGSLWEKPTSVEWINPDGSEGFQIDAGIRIHGGYSRQPTATAKHAFRLAFRSDYGAAKLDYPLFPDSNQTSFDTVVLRAQFNNAWAGVGASGAATFLQDQFARDTQLAMGDPSGHGRFVHLYLNGIYWGLYNITERSDADFAAQYLGGTAEDYDVMSTFAVADGNGTAWNTAISLANAGLASDAAYQQFKQYVDVENLADYIIVNVYGGNWDWPQNNWVAIRRSRVNGVAVNSYGFQFFSSDAEGTLENINADRSTADADNSPGRLYLKASENPEFKLMFADRLQKALFNGGALSTAGAVQTFTARSTEIDRAVVGESARWGDANSGTPLTRNANWAPQINWVTTQFMVQRPAVVLTQFKALGLYPSIDPPTFSQHGGLIVPNSNLTLTATAGLTIYMTTDGSDPRLPGGAVSPTASIYTGAIPLSGVLDLKVRTKTAAGVWSALDEGLFGPDTSKLRVTELMYSPQPPSIGSPYLTDDFQYVELQNAGTTSMNLGGVKFVNGIDYTFPNLTLAAGARVVVASNPDAFATRYPGVTVVGPFASGNLSDAGERVRLETAVGTQILDFSYDGTWYDLPQAQGYSLVVVDSAAAPTTWSSKASWRPSQYLGGNPTTADAGVNPGSIVINEVLANQAAANGNRIELYNTTAATIDISGWYLSNANNVLNKYRLPAGTTIAGGGYLVIDGSSFSNPSPGGTPFTFNLLGDQVYFSSADVGGNLGGYRESASFAASDPEVSYGRFIKSSGASDFVPLVTSTFGAANAAPKIGPVVISELMYHPATGNDEFIEIYNTTNQPIALYDPANPTNAWKFTAGVTYSFPTGAGAVTLPAQGFAVISSIDPVLFRSKYHVPAAVSVLGPYTGALDNAGEAIELSKPGVPLVDLTVPYIPIDRVKYQPDVPWPLKADGDGYSLSRVVAGNYGNESTNWTAGKLTGTPGATNVAFDDSPPTPPTSLIAGIVSASRIDLSWNFGADPQTGVSKYRVFRDAREIGVTTYLGFSDTTVVPGVTYSYQVAAVNGDLLDGPKGTAVNVSILGLSSAVPVGNSHVRVGFTGQVLAASATNLANYSIPGITITAAAFGPDGTSVMLSTSPLTDNVVYTLNVSGVASSTGDTLPPGATRTFSTAEGSGVRGEYFTDTQYTNFSFDRTDATIDFAWGGGSPDGRIGDVFSARWTGEILAKYTETYTFYTLSDDGVSLWVNGQQLVNDPTAHGDQEFSGTIQLVAGQRYTLKMQFFDSGGGATAKLFWSSPSQPKEIVPSSQLFLPSQVIVTDASKLEGASGPSAMVFNVELTRPSGTAVQVVYHTQNATAASGSDYTATGNVTVSVPPGTLSVPITVFVSGDSSAEANETFLLKIDSVTGASLFNTQATGTILDDDAKVVVGRSVFYNNSKFDGENPAAGAADDAAVAGDKSALLPGGKATTANYTSYSRGINGIMVDIPALPGTPTLADFVFKVGNSNTPASWAAAPAPQSIAVRPGAGLGGADRIELIWADGAIKNTWLQVTVLASVRTGLAAADVFYYGNAPGDSLDNPALVIVNATDEVQTRSHARSFLNPATITETYDFNRDGFVNATDQIIARSGTTTAATNLKLIAVPSSLGGLSQQVAPPLADSLLVVNANGFDETAVVQQTSQLEAAFVLLQSMPESRQAAVATVVRQPVAEAEAAGAQRAATAVFDQLGGAPTETSMDVLSSVAFADFAAAVDIAESFADELVAAELVELLCASRDFD